jgi:hypothetical protein
MKLKCTKCGESIELPLTVRWEEQGPIHRGYAGKKHIATIFERRVSDETYFKGVSHTPSGEFSKETLDEAKAEAQRLFEEWMGGLVDGL